MRIAATYMNGDIFQHFGHTESFKVYEIVDGKIAGSQIISSGGLGHGALAGLLSENSVDVLICGGIGGGAQMALRSLGIQIFGGVSGNADEAVKALIEGNLIYNPEARCAHHSHEGHSCGHYHGGHSCSHHHEDGHKCNCH